MIVAFSEWTLFGSPLDTFFGAPFATIIAQTAFRDVGRIRELAAVDTRSPFSYAFWRVISHILHQGTVLAFAKHPLIPASVVGLAVG
jgi:hypothetical protein